jgi:hypothetical protein
MGIKNKMHMKKLMVVQSIGAIMLFIIMGFFAACEGPAGAPGADGKDGKDGTNGTNGTNGVNGTNASESCRQCHNATSILVAKSLQLNHSLHVTGEAWLEGTRNNCAPCHSTEGFLDVIAKKPTKQKYLASASTLTDPTPLGCRACHKIHTAFDSTDFALTTVAAVDMLIDTTKVLTLDLGGSSNLCLKCHQPRIVKQMDFVNAPTTAYTAITSYRWGTHYGTQGAMVGGKGAFEFAGTETYSNSIHKANASCVKCHSGPASGISGGHTFSVVNEETGALNTLGCTVSGCHSSSATVNTMVTSVRTEIDALIIALGDKLATYLEKTDGKYTGYVDIYDANANPDAAYRNPNNGNVAFPAVTNKTAAAIANFQLVIRDKSRGVHNHPYIKALLTNTIAALP